MTELIPDQEGFTELVDPNVPRVDLVDVPANGAPGWLLMKQDAQAGLLSPQTIRDLIGKAAEPDPTEETVTMTGSPGAIAKLIHEAALRKAAENRLGVQPGELRSSDPRRDDADRTAFTALIYADLVKAKYHADDLKRMAANGQAMDDESYPIADKEDLSRAIRAVGRGGSSHDAIRRHIIRRAKALGASSEIPDNWAADGSLKEVTKMAATGDLDGDVDMNELDATIVLAGPDDMNAPGNANEPGSPAWEAIDAATARKWTSIAVRLRNALCVMAEREMLEAASADPDDAMAAWDLKDAECALDYVIDTLAGFAVEEQAEAELAAEMEAVGKAIHALDVTALDTFEALAPITKAGRVLSSANEAAIRGAVDSLQKVLASLPAAPIEKTSGPEVAKTANEEPNMPTPTPSEDATAASGQEPAMGAKSPEPKPVAGVPVTEMTKADGEKPPMVVVYDQKGRLIGIVDPGDVTPVANAEADADDMDEAGSADDGATPAAETTDLTPEPPAEAGTPADAVPTDDEAVTKTTNDTDLFKSSLLAAVESAFTEHSASQNTVLAKQADAVLELAELVATLKGRIGALEEQPAPPKVFTNGAVPPSDLRGMDRGAPPIDVAKAREMKRDLYTATATEQNRIAQEMQGSAIEMLSAIHRGGRRQ